MLDSIGAWLFAQFMDYLGKHIVSFGKYLFGLFKGRADDKKEAQSNVQPLKDAQTGEEIDEAADDLFRHT